MSVAETHADRSVAKADAASATRLAGPDLGVSVSGFGYYLPEGVITNADLARMVDTSDQWIIERTGIRSRHRAASDQATSDLAVHASRRAMEKASVRPMDLDMILVATATPDTPVPATSCLVQRELGAWRSAAMDVGAGCTGFLYAMHTASCFVRAGAARRVLVVGAETLTRVTDYADRRSCILFGDGAGAAVVTSPEIAVHTPRTPDLRLDLLYTALGADGREAALIDIPSGGSRRPASEQTVRDREHFLRLDGTAVFRQAVRRMAEAAREGLEATGLRPEDIDWILPHQANARIIASVADQVGIDPSRAMLDLAETGNTSAASIPITLGRARDSGSLNDGQRILMLAFGAGLTWAGQIWQVRAG